MIVYQELSSLLKDLGYSSKALYSLTNRIDRHYRRALIPKGNGETRKLCVPDPFLMAVQRRIAQQLLPLEPVSPHACAYRPGGSVRLNALPHVGAPVVVKMDVYHFFDHLTYPMVKEKAFPSFRYSEPNRILLAMLCTRDNALPQGAPTSPAISNILMRDFDERMGAWCRRRRIAYTRYCDDMTFSGDFDPTPLIRKVKRELKLLGLFPNDHKTLILRRSQCHRVTGAVVNEKLSAPADYKRSLRQELYYCRKFGVSSHLERLNLPVEPRQYLRSLLGKVNYVLSLESDNRDMADARQWLREEIKKAAQDLPS